MSENFFQVSKEFFAKEEETKKKKGRKIVTEE